MWFVIYSMVIKQENNCVIIILINYSEHLVIIQQHSDMIQVRSMWGSLKSNYEIQI